MLNIRFSLIFYFYFFYQLYNLIFLKFFLKIPNIQNIFSSYILAFLLLRLLFVVLDIDYSLFNSDFQEKLKKTYNNILELNLRK